MELGRKAERSNRHVAILSSGRAIYIQINKEELMIDKLMRMAKNMYVLSLFALIEGRSFQSEKVSWSRCSTRLHQARTVWCLMRNYTRSWIVPTTSKDIQHLNSEDCETILEHIWARLDLGPEEWRKIYKVPLFVQPRPSTSLISSSSLGIPNVSMRSGPPCTR